MMNASIWTKTSLLYPCTPLMKQCLFHLLQVKVQPLLLSQAECESHSKTLRSSVDLSSNGKPSSIIQRSTSKRTPIPTSRYLATWNLHCSTTIVLTMLPLAPKLSHLPFGHAGGGRIGKDSSLQMKPGKAGTWMLPANYPCFVYVSRFWDQYLLHIGFRKLYSPKNISTKGTEGSWYYDNEPSIP